ncbi:ABC transporter ATP-binding protein [Rhodococcoides kyotonense]|uniref:Peptide/nickel transport system ATP-binding protein n=1 Tax=Rhodococcoides kyotonense TaxID=398843 RepID=A0A239N1Z0_9NOCA|nr:dipeptide/oligopeptide/nickel ABC transporter ATP-binding protein [Rhodococcus kyotonensis]SNT48780.1 peptide/nickel transport system ATP-binding protein [Rhodococcus kyotonensis]
MSLDAIGITAGYPGTSHVLQDASLSVPAGELVGLAGPSGSGKSTMARVLSLLLAPQAGTVTIDGSSVRGSGFGVPSDVRRQVAMLFQSPRSATDPRMTLQAIIEQPAAIAGREIVARELAARVGLTPDLLTRRPHQVSDGQLQRACVARALAQEPKYLICDEATAMLDAATTASIMQLIRNEAEESGMGVLLISHDTELLNALCARVDDGVHTGTKCSTP